MVQKKGTGTAPALSLASGVSRVPPGQLLGAILGAQERLRPKEVGGNHAKRGTP